MMWHAERRIELEMGNPKFVHDQGPLGSVRKKMQLVREVKTDRVQ